MKHISAAFCNTYWRGIYFRCCFFALAWLFGFLASWLFGFLASWLFGLASWLFGFLASWLLGFSASCAFVLLVAFWLWLFASSAFPVPLWLVAFWLLRLVAGLCGFWWLWLFASLLSLLSGLFCFCPFHWFLALASRILSITSSSLSIITSSNITGGGDPPPTPPLLFRLFAEHPYLNHRFFNRLGFLAEI